LKKLIILLGIMMMCCNLFATHIVGGAFSLKWIAGDRYELTLKVLRDCKNSQVDFDVPAIIGVFDRKTHQQMELILLTTPVQRVLDFAGSNCTTGLPGECTTLGTYTKIIQLPAAIYDNNDGYYFSYQRCCRNNIIKNIQFPEDAGIAIYMEIPSPRFISNSTPYFTENPNTFLCVGSLTKYNFGFKDDDNDELRYSFVTPINGNLDRNNPINDLSGNPPTSGPYPRTVWSGSHNDNQPILGNPSLSIDPKTGEVSVSPVQSGIYVAAILVEEFRFGEKIGEVRLELQFNVTDCPQPVPVVSFKHENGTPASNSFVVQAPGKVCFDIEATDVTDSLFMAVAYGSGDSSIKPTFERSLTGLKKITNRVCWQTDCSVDKPVTQQYRIEVKDNGCPIATRAISSFSLTATPMPVINPTDILCMTLVNNQETIFYWGDSTGNSAYFKQHLIYRGIDNGTFTLYDSISNKSDREYHDRNTPSYSQVNYRYMMRAQNKCNISGPPSDTLGTFEQLKFIPDQQKLITVSVTDKKYLKVIWPKSQEKDFARYIVYKTSASNKKYTEILTFTNINDTGFVDKDVDVNSYSYCYHVVMKDTCDNYGPAGLEACSILLSGKAAAFSNTISWSPYNYWESGTANYEIVAQGNATPFSRSAKLSPVMVKYTDRELDHASGFFSYYVVARQKGADQVTGIPGNPPPPFFNAESYSNEIQLVQRPLVHIPNAFTPNQDQLNDIWDIRDMYVKDFHLTVYDKWGKLIFETTDKAYKWTGEGNKGAVIPSDVYIYQLHYTGYDNSAYTTKGNVTILR
jgi:gliding motility-associated-like protein